MPMETALFDLAAKNGLWAALFVCLFIYTMIDTRSREKAMRQTLAENQRIMGEAMEKLNIVKEIREDTKDIKDIKTDVKDIKAEVFRR